MLVALALLVPALAVFPTTGAAAGSACTIRGTSGNDRLVGTARDDVICGLGGNDELIGGGGDDRFDGGGGRDVIRGGGGDDLDFSSSGADQYSGGNGYDQIWYLDRTSRVVVDLDGVADDGASGEKDNVMPDVERVTGTEYRDVLVGNAADNRLDGYGNEDVLRGLDGDDVLMGGNLGDELSGGEGNDRLLGGTHADLLNGGPGADVLSGQTEESFRDDMCDSDPLDTVTSCVVDGEGPAFSFTTIGNSRVSVVRGQQFTMTTHVFDQAETSTIDLRVTQDGQPVSVCPARMTIAGSDPVESIWKATCAIPRTAALGAYVITPVAVDGVGNRNGSAIGQPGSGVITFAVVSGEPDTTSPLVQSVEVVDADRTVSPGDPLVVRVGVSDASGVRAVSAVFRHVTTPGPLCDPESSRLVSGDVTDGVWEVPCTVRDLVRNGTYTVRGSGVDPANNRSEYGTAQDELQVVGGSDDSTGPEIHSLSLSRTTGTPGQAFTVTVSASDPLGVDSFYGPFAGPGGSNGFCYGLGTLESGTIYDGTWTVQCAVPTGTAAGSWVTRFEASDRLGNWSYAPETMQTTFTVS